jgi:hypothetical protein
VPPLTRAAAASAGVKVDSFISDEAIKTNQKQTSISTRSSVTRKRKASEDDQRPYLDLLKMKQVINRSFVFKETFSIVRLVYTRMFICIAHSKLIHMLFSFFFFICNED